MHTLQGKVNHSPRAQCTYVRTVYKTSAYKTIDDKTDYMYTSSHHTLHVGVIDGLDTKGVARTSGWHTGIRRFSSIIIVLQ